MWPLKGRCNNKIDSIEIEIVRLIELKKGFQNGTNKHAFIALRMAMLALGLSILEELNT